MITGHDKGGVTISFDSGIARIPQDQLPPDLRKELGYDRGSPAEVAAAEKAKAGEAVALEERIKKFGFVQKLARAEFPYELSDYISYYNEMADHINNGIRNDRTEFIATDQAVLASRKTVYEAYRSYITSETDRTLEQRTRKAIAQKSCFIGMDEAAVKVILGVPDQINITRAADHVITQYMYGHGSKYLQFTDGKLTSEQN